MTRSSSDHELSLTISPYGYIEWRGSRARIEATGLLVRDALSIKLSKVHTDERIEKFEVRLLPQDKA